MYHKEAAMQCPKCHFVSDARESCPKCGIVFEKFRQSAIRKAQDISLARKSEDAMLREIEVVQELQSKFVRLSENHYRNRWGEAKFLSSLFKVLAFIIALGSLGSTFYSLTALKQTPFFTQGQLVALLVVELMGSAFVVAVIYGLGEHLALQRDIAIRSDISKSYLEKIAENISAR